MQTLDFNQILTLISIGSTLVVGYILSHQIKSQKQLIEQYKLYIETLDIKKFKDYINTMDDLNEKKIKAEIEKKEIEMKQFKEKNANKYAAQATELTRLISYFMNSSEASRENKIEFLKEALPLTFSTVSLAIK